MAHSNISNLTAFDRGIIRISHAQQESNIKLPDAAKVRPSDATVEARLTKLWKAASLENIMHQSFTPNIQDKDNFNPTLYQQRLQDAKKTFKKLAEEGRKRKKKKKQYPDEEDEDEIFEQISQDLEELEGHQDLLWLLRQVVHLA